MRVFRRKDPSPSKPEPASSPASSPSSMQQHHHMAKSMPVLGAADFLEREGVGAPTAAGGCGGRRTTLKWAALLMLALFLFVRLAPESQGHRHTEFVKVEGTQLMLDCRPFYIAGFNVESLPELGSAGLAAANGGRLAAAGGRQAVRTLLEKAAGAGMNAVRTFAHTTDARKPLQVQPGVYSEAAFRGLDVVIAEAERAGLRVLLSLTDNWKYAGGVDEYVDWSSTVPPRDPRFPGLNDTDGDVSTDDFTPERKAYENVRKTFFYKDEEARRMYKNHVRAVLDRVNHLTGLRYSEDPTILAFNLLNELRCSAYETRECTDLVTKWVLEMAQHFKSLDQKHLLTVGSEGFWGERDVIRDMNPGAPASDWASKSGQDFIANHGLPQIDFASFHLWSDNWNIYNETFHRQWVNKHMEDCQTVLKKPCLLEEFGKKVESKSTSRAKAPPKALVAQLRDPLFASVYSAIEQGIASRQSLAGSLYWRWGLNVHNPGKPGVYGVLPGDSTFQVISLHAQRVRNHMLGQPPHNTCALDCWVPAESFSGLLRRCEHRPSVCADLRARKPLPAGASLAQLQTKGPRVFASQQACCLPGLGGFRSGCTVTLF